MSQSNEHQCRAGCGACCIAPSISTATPGHPQGKKAGLRCVHLNQELLCDLFGQAARPRACADFHFDTSVCGQQREEALDNIQWLEEATE
ncbi:YkgJ family cysteine cluster protein [Marinospirillum perlucidum]|uniref:YkgJ family cysteine cluster protein n=1 Tax=Marinospirillum perlucidum TaxID=1982602 RepID=UPI000DF250FD|nr:YkgJ family cysteine cluster protein [Marinospirillum perlucidum]